MAKRRKIVQVEPSGTFARARRLPVAEAGLQPQPAYVDPACPECGKLWEIDGHRATCSRLPRSDGQERRAAGA